jgi:hypothetical protein
MNKASINLKRLLVIFICCSSSIRISAQQPHTLLKNTSLQIKFIDKDSSFVSQALKLQTTFGSETEAVDYIGKLPALLTAKGYPVASVDSSWSADSVIYATVYLGTRYNWIQLTPVNIEKGALEEGGFSEKNFLNKPFSIAQLQLLQQRMLNYYEKQGHPFASVYLDSVRITDDKINALLKANKGILYAIDSIRVYGKVNLNKKFLQRYLDISNHARYGICFKSICTTKTQQPDQFPDRFFARVGRIRKTAVNRRR